MINNNYYWNDKESRAKLAQKHTKDMDERYLNEINESIKNTYIYTYDLSVTKKDTNDLSTMTLLNTDSVSAIFSNEAYRKIAILNFASYKNPGGGFIIGSRAQEECLCHESFLYNVLNKFPEYYEWNNKHKNKGLYLNRALYSPNIVFEHNDEVQKCDVITCAAPNASAYFKYNDALYASNQSALKDRIDFILKIAFQNNVDTLILGAFGCGVFKQDAANVATIFKHNPLLFKIPNVIFAVPTTPHKENYEAFYKVLFG